MRQGRARTGHLRFVFAAAVLLLAALAGALSGGNRAEAAIWVVDNTSDDGTLTACTAAPNDCSLRGAMRKANVTGSGNIINFDAAVFPSATPATIFLGSQLSIFTQQTIDATGRGVIVKGEEARTFSCFGIDHTAPGSIIRGLQITDCDAAIKIIDSTQGGMTIANNNLFDNRFGVFIGGGRTIPGSTITGNKIGANAAGTAVHPEGGNDRGIEIFDFLFFGNAVHIIGGSDEASRNIISGNGFGIVIRSPLTDVRGNFIGTDVTGTANVSNAADGIFISGSDNDIRDNIIAFNRGNGVLVQGTAGLNVMQGNSIHSNGWNGVLVEDTASRNPIRGNSIHSNGGLGIDLAPLGVTANDMGDGDTGGNSLQNFPVLTEALKRGGSTEIRGTLNSTASTTFDIELFSNAVCDPSGNGEGEKLIGTLPVTTDGSGNVSFTFNTSDASVVVGKWITGTATRESPVADTSEFSDCEPVLGLTVDTTSDANLTACTAAPNDCSLRGAINTANASGPGDIIDFDAAVFPSAAPASIVIGDVLPALIAGSDTIDGTGRGVIVRGPEARTLRCFTVNTSGNSIRGLQITDCFEGVLIAAGSNNTIGPGNTCTTTNAASPCSRTGTW